MTKRTCLEVKGLSKWFGGLAANLEIDFAVAEGEIVSVIGPNGAGKSTLFNCITGFYKPTSGKELPSSIGILRDCAPIRSANSVLPGHSR